MLNGIWALFGMAFLPASHQKKADAAAKCSACFFTNRFYERTEKREARAEVLFPASSSTARTCTPLTLRRSSCPCASPDVSDATALLLGGTTILGQTCDELGQCVSISGCATNSNGVHWSQQLDDLRLWCSTNQSAMCGAAQEHGFPTKLTWKTALVEWALGLDFKERVSIHRIHGCKIGGRDIGRGGDGKKQVNSKWEDSPFTKAISS